MGKIFISYASEDRGLASDINERLRQAGHQVFFDESNLKPSDAYDRVIQGQLAKSDIMLFLCSRHSLAPGRYTLTELEMAKSIWAKPQGRVLPVLLGDTGFDDLPSYLKGLSAYRQKGDPVSEISHMADELVRQRQHKKRLTWGGGIAAALVLAAGTYVAGMQVTADGSDIEMTGTGTPASPPEGSDTNMAAVPPPKPEMDPGLPTLSITDSMLENPRTFEDVKFNVPDTWSFCPGTPFNLLNKSSQRVMVTIGAAQTGDGYELGAIEAGDYKVVNALEEAEFGFVLLDMDSKNYFYWAELNPADCE